MLRKVLVCFTTLVLVGASLVPEDALAFRGGGRSIGYHGRASSFGGGTARSVHGYHGGRYAVAGRGYGYRRGAYRAAAWRGTAYGTAAAVGSAYGAYGYAGAPYGTGAPYGAYGYGSLRCAPGPRVGAFATAPWTNKPTCAPY